MRLFKLFAALSIALCLLACNKEKDNPSDPGKKDTLPTDGGGHDIKNVDGIVRFFVYMDGDRSLEGYRISVNGVLLDIKDDGNGHKCVDVEYSPFESYSAILYDPSATKFYGDKINRDITIPLGQFPNRTDDFRGIPVFCQYTKETKDILRFKPNFAFVDIQLTGSATVSSIHFEADTAICGQFDYNYTTREMTMTSSAKTVNMNCTNSGSGTTASTGKFSLCILPGTYRSIDVRICGMDNRVCFSKIENLSVSGGDVHTVIIAYEPDPKVVFYDAFDNFVWGGDMMGGSNTSGWSPDAETVTSTGAQGRTGYEYAFTKTGYTNPGSGYIQIYNDKSADAKNKPVGEYHSMSGSYCKSRNIDGYWMYRVQEFQGCIGLGVDAMSRAIFKTPAFANVGGLCEGYVEFDYCFKENMQDNIEISLTNGGAIKSVEVDGQVRSSEEIGYNRRAINGKFIQKVSVMSKPSAISAPKEWHHVKIQAEGINSSSRIEILPSNSTAMYHGFYLDNFKVTKTSDIQTKPAGITRLLYWNIQNGMWAGLGDNYEKFVTWVRKYNPDICVWCEAKSNNKYPDGTTGSLDWNNNGWANLAARYGHNYSCPTGSRVNGSGDNFPQEVTATAEVKIVNNYKYSANCVDTTGKTRTLTSHGGGHVKVQMAGHTLNIVPLHLVPGTVYSSQNIDQYQVGEIKFLLESSVLNSKYSDQTDWIWLGDHNCQSPQDKWYYDIVSTSFKRYSALQYLLDNTNLIDAVKSKNDDLFYPSTGGDSRIDYVFLSPALSQKVVRAINIVDDYAYPKAFSGTSYYNPSDHRPVLVDFKF